MKRSDPFSGREQRSASPQPVQMGRRQTLHPERCNGNWFLDTRVPVMVTARKVSKKSSDTLLEHHGGR